MSNAKPTTDNSTIPEESLKRWADTINDGDATNTQILGTERPSTEEGFLVLSIIDGKRWGIKQFNVTHAIQEVANRQRSRAEYFSTNAAGDKIGVSVEWRKEPEEKNEKET